MASVNCISSNPDISGIGVRVAVYAQTFLSFVPALLFTYDGKLDLEEEESLLGIYTPLLVTSMALLITTSIQQVSIGLGNHHILLVLNLMWMMNASALVLCVVPTLEWLGRSDDDGVLPLGNAVKKDRRWKILRWLPRLSRVRDLLFWWPRRSRQLLAVIFVSVHLSGMGVLGIWHWSVLRIQGLRLPPSECFEKINATYLFMDFPITSSKFRTLSLIFYAFMVVPVVNIEISVLVVNLMSWLIFFLVPSVLRRMFPRVAMWMYVLFELITILISDSGSLEWLVPRFNCILAVLFPLIITVHTVIDTELMMKRNTPLMGTDESQWTFGQILALLLVILPLLEVLSIFTKATPLGARLWRWATDIHYTPASNRSFNISWLTRRLLVPSQPWSHLYKEVDEEFQRARSALTNLGKEFVELTEVDTNPTHLSFPCVAASAIFALRSLLVIADQALKITNETFTFPGHPPFVAPILGRPNYVEVYDNVSLIRLHSRRKRRRKGKKGNIQEQKIAEAQIGLALTSLKSALTEARDNISMAQSVRFSDIHDSDRYNAAAGHLRHLLIILDTTLETFENLELTRACYLRESQDVYHVCHFNYGDAVGQMKSNLVYDFGGMFERDFKEQAKSRENGVDLVDLKEFFDDGSQTGSSSSE